MSTEFKAVLMMPTKTILREIAMPEMKRRSIAMTYALCMRSAAAGEAVDWAAINKAIMDRWSVSGLAWIKTQAASGKCFGGAA
jgi:thymidine phosphorylase